MLKDNPYKSLIIPLKGPYNPSSKPAFLQLSTIPSGSEVAPVSFSDGATSLSRHCSVTGPGKIEISTGVKTEKIDKGRIWADLGDIWRICLEILPLQKSKEKPRKPNEKPRKA